jgi:hypothetical protein
MAIAQARSEVAAPTRAPLPYGLLSVAQSQPMAEAHERNGVTWDPEPCGPAGVTADPCPSPPPDKQPTTSLSFVAADPFTVWSWIDCSALGLAPGERAEAMVRRALENGEERAVERVFWTGSARTTGGGDVTVQPHLAEDTAAYFDTQNGRRILQPAAVVATTGASDIITAVGAIEATLAWCYGNQGVLHIPRMLAPMLANAGLVRTQGNQMLTNPNGNLVALGAGYTGTGPSGTLPAGSMWIYGTGAVSIHRSEVDVPAPWGQAIDKAKNDLALVAERTYVVGWDCCLVAAQVTTPGLPQGVIGNAGPA